MSDVLAWVTLVAALIAIISVLVSWRKDANKSIVGRTELDTKTKAEITQMSEDISEIKKTLGNGYTTGLKGTVNEIKNNCGRQTSRIVTLIEAHMNTAGHGSVPQDIARLNALVKNLERANEWDGVERRHRREDTRG
jgi:hypothetical protein